MPRPRFRLRTDAYNPLHVRFTVFGNGANCGQLCMTVPEWTKFCTALKLSAGVWDAPIELEFEHEGTLFERVSLQTPALPLPSNDQIESVVRELVDHAYDTGYYSGKGEDGQPHHTKAIEDRESARRQVVDLIVGLRNRITLLQADPPQNAS